MTVLAFPRATKTEGLVGGDESFSRVPYDQLRAAGITSLIRYITGSGKGMDRAEFQAGVDAGFCFAWVMETFEQAASLGYSQGVKEGRAAYAAADAIGWPADRPGYFVLEDPSPIPRSAWPAVVDYVRAVVDLAPQRPLPGGYGSGALCAYVASFGLLGHQWHVSTWPGLNRSVADIVQEANGLRGYGNFGGAIDLNTIRDDNPDWGQHPFDAPAPPPPDPPKRKKVPDMFLFNHGGGVWLHCGDSTLTLLTNDQVTSMLEAGVPSLGDVTDDQFAQITGKAA